MAKHLKIKTTKDNHVHFEWRNAYTLCGLETTGDSHLGIKTAIDTDKKVNCNDCIDIVNYCKSINKSEFTK